MSLAEPREEMSRVRARLRIEGVEVFQRHAVAQRRHVRNGAQLASTLRASTPADAEGQLWYWPPGIFDLATGTSERIPLDYAQDFHHMAWTPDGKVMAVAVGFRGSIWKFTPEGK